MRVLIVDDHAVVRQGIRRVLASLPGIVAWEASNALDAMELYRLQAPDVVVLDVSLDHSSGLELLQRLIAVDRAARIVMFTMHGDAAYVARALEAGAMGYVSKGSPAEELRLAVEKAAAGQRHVAPDLAVPATPSGTSAADPLSTLSNRELEILRLLGEGKTMGDIAVVLGLAYKTVANTSSLLKEKLGLSRTADLVRLAVERRLK
ncbi:MAG: response regulator [Hyphomicrobium sp.]